jgi:hypothetical protein
MDAKDVIKRLRNAKTAHLGWVSRAGALIEGKAVDKEKIPVLPTDCIFGSWYYSDGKNLAHLNAYHEIEAPHNELHEIYAEIFNLLFGKEKGSFFSRLTGLNKEQKLNKARQRFHDLQKVSNIIMEKLDALENEIRMVSAMTNKSSDIDLNLPAWDDKK